MKNLLICLLFFFLFSHLSLSKWCKGMICDDDCNNCKYQCDPATCLPANNCKCASKSIPNNLSKDQTPQFVLFTLDDIFNERLMPVIKYLDFLLQDASIVDANGCRVRVSAYSNAYGRKDKIF